MILTILAPFLRFSLYFTCSHPSILYYPLLIQNILFIFCCHTCTEHLPSRYVQIIHWFFLVYWISAIFLPIFGIFQCIPPSFTLIYTVKLILHTFTYHTEHIRTWIASYNVLWCKSCYYQSHLIILLGSDLGVQGHLWSQNDVIIEADSHLKKVSTSMLDIYKVFEHIDMLSMGIQ